MFMESALRQTWPAGSPCGKALEPPESLFAQPQCLSQHEACQSGAETGGSYPPSDNRLDLLVKTFQSIVCIVQKLATGQLLNHSPLFTKWVSVMLKVCAHTTRRSAQQLCT